MEKSSKEVCTKTVEEIYRKAKNTLSKNVLPAKCEITSGNILLKMLILENSGFIVLHETKPGLLPDYSMTFDVNKNLVEHKSNKEAIKGAWGNTVDVSDNEFLEAAAELSVGVVNLKKEYNSGKTKIDSEKIFII